MRTALCVLNIHTSPSPTVFRTLYMRAINGVVLQRDTETCSGRISLMGSVLQSLLSMILVVTNQCVCVRMCVSVGSDLSDLGG